MSEEFPELDRGQAAAVTKREHVPTWMYKQAHHLTDEMEQIRCRITDVQEIAGHGVQAVINGMTVLAGNAKLMERELVRE